MSIRKITMVALFTALTAAGAFVKIPFVPAAITLQLLFTLMAGILLGAKLGALSQVIYILLGLAGLPIFAAGGGIGYILKPSFGFVAALPLAALTAGMLTRGGIGFRRVLLSCAAASLVVYLVGVPYMWMIINLFTDGGSMSVGAALMSGMVVFLPGDTLKCLATATVATRLARFASVRAIKAK